MLVQGASNLIPVEKDRRRLEMVVGKGLRLPLLPWFPLCIAGSDRSQVE